MNNLENIYLNEFENAWDTDFKIASVSEYDMETETESKIASLIVSKSKNLIELYKGIINQTETHTGNTTLMLREF